MLNKEKMKKFVDLKLGMKLKNIKSCELLYRIMHFINPGVITLGLIKKYDSYLSYKKLAKFAGVRIFVK